jgi:MFS family permease
LFFDAATAGFISSGASLAYGVGAIVGFFVAVGHPRLLILAAGLSASLGAAGMAASYQTEIFAIVGSAGAGLASPGLVSIVRRNVTALANDRSQAMANACTGPGLTVAGILALVPLPDWRLAWFLVAACRLAIAIAIAIAIDALVLDRGGRLGPAPENGANPPALLRASWLTNHRQTIVAAFFMGARSAAVWNYGRTLLVDAGASEHTSVTAWIALGIGGTVAIGIARLMSTLDPRTARTITTLTAAAASSTLALAPTTTAAALAACAAFGWGSPPQPEPASPGTHDSIPTGRQPEPRSSFSFSGRRSVPPLWEHLFQLPVSFRLFLPQQY